MSRYEGRLLQLQAALENTPTEEDRHLIVGELAALKEAYGLKPHETLGSGH
jgi:hypothetical protein